MYYYQANWSYELENLLRLSETIEIETASFLSFAVMLQANQFQCPGAVLNDETALDPDTYAYNHLMMICLISSDQIMKLSSLDNSNQNTSLR